MRKGLLLSCIVLALFSRALAGTVTVQTAQAVALNYFKLNAPQTQKTELTATLKYTQAESNGAVDFYVFDISPVAGFVIVTGYDNVEPVIGFSTESNFKTNFKINGVSDWVKISGEKINYAAVNHLVASAEVNNHWEAYKLGQNPGDEKASSVAPLAVTTWNQENDISNPPPYLYNLDCPYNSSEKQRCVTGCVATAMAQIMAYWAYPAKGTGSYSYSATGGYGTLSADFGTTTYDWASAPSVLTDNTSTTLAAIVDLVSYHAGVAVAMSYGTDDQGGSGAWVIQSDAGSGKPCAQQAYVKYFGYDASTIQGLKKSAYTTAAWTSLIEGELNAKRIVQYAGQGSDGGHTWLCDGYNTSGLYHMNWGWGGADNGYFSLTKLDADGAKFNSDEEALIGIEPGKSGSDFKGGSANTGGSTGSGEKLTMDLSAVSTAITLYPNPAQNNLNIQFGSSDNGTVTVNVYNVTGQRVISSEQSSVSGSNLINISTGQLSNGVYVFELQNNGQVQRQKFVIER